MTDNQFFHEPGDPLRGSMHRIPTQPGTTTMGQGAEGEVASLTTYEPGEPVIEVPEDAVAVDTDVTVADELVAYTPDGTVIDTREVGTVITTSDGVRVTIDAEGRLHVDADFDNEDYVDDESTLAEGAELTTASGTNVARNAEGSVVVTQPNGQVLTLHDDGSVDVDLPEDGDPGLGGELGDGSGVLPAGGDTGAEDAEGDLEGEEESVEEAEEDLDDALEEEPAPPVPPTATPGDDGGGGPTGGPGGPTGGPGGPTGAPDTDGPSTDPGVDPDDPGSEEPETEEPRPEDPCPDEPRPDNPCGGDFTVTPGDLRSDGRCFEGLVPSAQSLSGCWDAMGGLIQHWGLWGFAQGPFTNACAKFSGLYQDGAAKLEHIGRDLHASADDYEEAEAHGVAAAHQIPR